jgi:hypothetical protein
MPILERRKNSDEKFNVIYEYTTDDGYGTTQEFTVPPNGYFVMGDNRITVTTAEAGASSLTRT